MDLDPMAQADVERLIHQLMGKASEVTVEVGRRARAAAEAETDYRIKYAKEFLQANGSVEARKATAEVACADELRARKMADALLLSAREAGLNARARLDAARTIASNIRSAVTNATGYGA